MSPERQAFKNIEEWLAGDLERKHSVDINNGVVTHRDDCPCIQEKQKLIEEAKKAFYEDHPEVRFLMIRPDDRLEVNFFGEHPAYKYFAEELTDEHSKLKKCLEIFEALYRQL